MEKNSRGEIFRRKQLTEHYVNNNPALAMQQHGQRRIIRELFDAFFLAGTKATNLDLFPVSVRELLPSLPASGPESTKSLIRTIIDFIASLSEEQAISTHHRVYGIALGSSLAHTIR